MVSHDIYCLMLGSRIIKLGPVETYEPTYIYNQAISILLPKILHFICITTTAFSAVLLVNSIMYLTLAQQTNVL